MEPLRRAISRAGRRIGRKMGLTPFEADDVAQETLLAFAKSYRAGNYDPSRGRLSKWLFGITYRQALDARRARGKAPVQGPANEDGTTFWRALPDEEATTRTGDDSWERKLLDRVRKQVRREVADHTYRVFEMIVRQGRTPDEVCGELGMSRPAAYTAKHRILKRIREIKQRFEAVP